MTAHWQQLTFTFNPWGERDVFGRRVPFNPDYSRLSYCECGEDFLLDVRERFGTVLDHPSIRSLDEAILTLSIDYAERLKTLPSHPLNTCVPEVFSEILLVLTAKRDELLRHPKKAQQAHLFVGMEKVTPSE